MIASALFMVVLFSGPLLFLGLVPAVIYYFDGGWS